MIDPLVLAKQRAILHGSAAVRALFVKRPRRAGPKMTKAMCPRCAERHLAKKNNSGVCGECWMRMSRQQRRALLATGLVEQKRRKPRVADLDTIARARARLAAKGIIVDNAQEAA